MGEKIRSWLIVISAWIAGITIALLVFVGPGEAANFIGWVKDTGGEVVSSIKIFIQEVKKQK